MCGMSFWSEAVRRSDRIHCLIMAWNGTALATLEPPWSIWTRARFKPSHSTSTRFPSSFLRARRQSTATAQHSRNSLATCSPNSPSPTNPVASSAELRTTLSRKGKARHRFPLRSWRQRTLAIATWMETACTRNSSTATRTHWTISFSRITLISIIMKTECRLKISALPKSGETRLRY